MQPFMFPLAKFVAGQVVLQDPAAGILRPQHDEELPQHDGGVPLTPVARRLRNYGEQGTILEHSSLIHGGLQCGPQFIYLSNEGLGPWGRAGSLLSPSPPSSLSQGCWPCMEMGRRPWKGHSQHQAQSDTGPWLPMLQAHPEMHASSPPTDIPEHKGRWGHSDGPGHDQAVLHQDGVGAAQDRA